MTSIVLRSEREVAADTVNALLVEGLIPDRDRTAATAAAGLTYTDIEAARHRRRRRGFVAPSDHPPEPT